MSVPPSRTPSLWQDSGSLSSSFISPWTSHVPMLWDCGPLLTADSVTSTPGKAGGRQHFGMKVFLQEREGSGLQVSELYWGRDSSSSRGSSETHLELLVTLWTSVGSVGSQSFILIKGVQGSVPAVTGAPPSSLSSWKPVSEGGAKFPRWACRFSLGSVPLPIKYSVPSHSLVASLGQTAWSEG